MFFIMECFFCGYKRIYKYGKICNVINDIIVFNVYKFLFIMLIFFIIGKKLDIRKFLWFYRFMLKVIV